MYKVLHHIPLDEEKALDDLKDIIFNKKKVNEFKSRVTSKLTKNLLDLE